MFTTIIVQPIFNLLVLIYALIPGHNFGLAIILFTIIVRLLLWPLVRKQLHHAKAIRELAPEIKKIKARAAGDKQKERALTMELYKEREVNPLASLGIIAVQAVIFIGLFLGLNRVIRDPQQIINFSYSPLHDLSWMQTLAKDIKQFDNSLFGIIDLHRTAVGQSGLYAPALLLALGSAVAQFFQGRQLMPKSQDGRSLRQILREAGRGKQADQQEVNVAVGRSTLYILPVFIFVISLNFAAALPLYWFTGSLVAIWQQGRILKEDVDEALPNGKDKKRGAGKLKVTYRTEGEAAKSNKQKAEL
ncbi:YidC/Oxa1 family membrane protein insertase [Candidatus Saccharibacteria bacterium]|nr:YidC/Oxa1 family membrane protein insertase [Candidatus Saccharibacteria bacterium]